MNSTKSRELKELEKRLSRKRKERSEEKIKEILKKKEIDYDTVTTILDIFRKSKFQWKKEHFDVFESRPNEFRGKELPDNNRECVMLGVRLGTMRSKVIYNLKGLQITEKQKHDIDELIWNFIWYQWREVKTINDFLNQENSNPTKKEKDIS
jgi:hypothetical protein